MLGRPEIAIADRAGRGSYGTRVSAPFARDNGAIQHMFNEGFMIARTDIVRMYGKLRQPVLSRAVTHLLSRMHHQTR